VGSSFTGGAWKESWEAGLPLAAAAGPHVTAAGLSGLWSGTIRIREAPFAGRRAATPRLVETAMLCGLIWNPENKMKVLIIYR
jgi:hypothetical protein